MNREEMFDAASSLLKNDGFRISKRCTSRPSCFCLAARKRSDVVFLRISEDIGKISLRDAFELRTISAHFSATPLLIGEKARLKQLEDDTVYTRYNIYAITLKTLEDIVRGRMLPLVEARPGGYYVRLDAEGIREKRIKLGLSVGRLAEQLRISRRTLYGYERGMAKASVSAAYNLEWILGIPVVKPIDIFKPALPEPGFFAKAKRLIVRNRFLKTVLTRLVLWNFNVSATTRAPFDFVAEDPNENVKILGGVVHQGERKIQERAEEILSISDVVEAQPVFITDGKDIPGNNIPTIYTEELERMHLAEDLVSRL